MDCQQQPTASDDRIIALARILQTLREEENVDVLLQTTLSHLRSQFNYSLIWIGFYDRLEHQLVGKGGITPTGETDLLLQRFSLSPGDLLEQVVIQLRHVVVPGLQAETRGGEWRSIAARFDIEGTLLYPIRHRDRCFGVVLLGSTSWGISPSDDETSHLSIVLGTLGTSLCQLETRWQQQQLKRLDEPLFKLLSRLSQPLTPERSLEAVVDEIHRFIEPSRTSVYWYAREGRYFWRRAGTQQKLSVGGGHQASSGITVQDLGDFYSALKANRLVSIGEAYSSLSAGTTGILMEKIRARSLLAAPIGSGDDLLGFVAVEGQQPRIWQESEKLGLQAIAQLLSLTAPVWERSEKIQQIEFDRALTAGSIRAIANPAEGEAIFQDIGDRLSRRLGGTRVLLLQGEPQTGFDAIYQTEQIPEKRPVAPLPMPLSPPSEAEWETLHSEGVVAVENWAEERILASWRQPLWDNGVRSLLVAHGILSHPDHFCLLVICHESPRSWDSLERDLVRQVGQQLSAIVRQWHLHRELHRCQQIQSAIARSWEALRDTRDIQSATGGILQAIAEFLESPRVYLVALSEVPETAKIVAVWTADGEPVPAGINIPVAADPLIQTSLSGGEIIFVEASQLSPETRNWLPGTVDRQIGAIALRTAPQHGTRTLLLAIDPQNPNPTDDLQPLATQLAWCCRYLQLGRQLETQQQTWAGLNWYKHRRLDWLYRTVGSGLKQLQELDDSPLNRTEGHKQQLAHLRQQQLLRQIGNALATTAPAIKQEQWQLRYARDPIPIASLLRHVRSRIDPLLRKRGLILPIRRDWQGTIAGDRLKLELAIGELLQLVCYGSREGDAIQITVSPPDRRVAIVTIEPASPINPRRFDESVPDWLEMPPLARSPARHWLICRRIVEQMGGQLQLKSDTIHLILPLAD
ncbi:MAG: GAF domain-containing protein [Limnospira sp.]